MRVVYHHKKDTGVTYVYEVIEEYWDKEKKQMRNKQRCIGKLDPETGEFIPSKRLGPHAGPALDPAITATTTITGPRLILQQIDQDLGLSSVLKKACPNHWAEIMSLAWYIVNTGKALAHAGAWCAGHEAPSKQDLSSQRISDLLDAINEDQRQHFFKLWGKNIAEKDHLCYDITSISSYSEQNAYVRYGYNRDGEPLPQVNLALVFGQQTFLPVSYRVLPGSITDKKTLAYLLDSFDKLEYPRLHLVMDRGFYSQENIDHLLKKQQHFTLGVPTHLKWIREQIDTHRQTIDSHLGLRKVEDGHIYAHTVLLSLGENKRRAYLHLYFDAQRMTDDRMAFDQQILQYYEELTCGKTIDEHEEAYQQFFKVKRTPKRGLHVEYLPEAIDAARKKYVGFSAILTTKWKDAVQALAIYREKDVVEKAFDDLKNDLDMNRIRVQSSQRMQARLFIQFIALILLSRIRKTLREKLSNTGWTAKSILMELETLTTIHYSGQYQSLRSEATKKQRSILEAFNIQT